MHEKASLRQVYRINRFPFSLDGDFQHAICVLFQRPVTFGMMVLPFQPIGIGEDSDVNPGISLQEAVAPEMAGRLPDHLERAPLDFKVRLAFSDAPGFVPCLIGAVFRVVTMAVFVIAGDMDAVF